MKRWVAVFVSCAGLAWACQFDGTLRAYLSVSFWSPFFKSVETFERKSVKRVNVAYAGMGSLGANALGRLRAEYRRISQPQVADFDATGIRAALAAARGDRTLSVRDLEEVELIDAKIDMRAGGPNRQEPLRMAQAKLEAFLKSAQTPEWLSEARGWLAYTHYLLHEQTEAGKLYLDELNRDGSNLSRQGMLDSLSMTYGRYGEGEILKHIEEYFDSAEHAAFAVQLVTNPREGVYETEPYQRVNALVLQHRELLNGAGGDPLVLLLMRTALRMGDPAQAMATAAMASGRVRSDTDFLWMLASAHYVSRDYAGAEAPLREMFESLETEDPHRHAAAYGLCGVYDKTGNRVEQLRYALWLANVAGEEYFGFNSEYDGQATTRNLGVYWAFSGWDLNLLLDGQASLEELREVVSRYPGLENIRLVKYAIAVRLAREDKYTESAAMYESIGQPRRMLRMRQLAKLWADGSPASKYAFANVLSDHGNGVYYNDSLWHGFQRYALSGESDSRLTKDERERQVALERELRDTQEEHWRAFKILREVMDSEGRSDLGRRAAQLAQKNLRVISTDRFGRAEEVAQADRDVTAWLAGR